MSSPRSPDPLPAAARIEALRTYDILDTASEESFERIVDLARHALDVPIALVSFLDADREWIKARKNFPPSELRREISFGVHVLEANDLLVVEDTHADIRFAENPLVTDNPGIRFYAGAPLLTPDRHCIGTVAVMDTEKRDPSASALSQLQTLADLVVQTLHAQRSPRFEETLVAPPYTPAEASSVVLDAQGTILQTSAAWKPFARKTGFDNPSALGPGTNYLDVFAPAHDSEDPLAQRVRAGLERVLQGEQQMFETAYPCHTPHQKRWLHIQAMPLDHPRAEAIVLHQNVTALKEQQRQHRFLETAVEQAQEVVLITEGAPLDEPGPRITYVNPAFTDVTGYEPDEVIGKTPRILQGPDTEPWVLREMRQQLERGESFEGEAINYRKDGTPYVNQWSIAPVYSDSGELTHWVSVQRDVSEDRQMEKRLLKAQERERQRIARTMHDEMGGLLASLQMALDTAQSDEPRPADSLDDIQDVANELSTVVRTLTERLHSRVLEDYGLARALSRLTNQFSDRYGLHIEVHNELSADASLPSLLEKIAYRGIHEALANVVQHAETDQAQVLVNREAKKVQIHVIDDGVGFNPAVELTGEDQHGLVGLKERIVRLNGKLEIDSAPTAGTRVSMTLPLTLVSLLERQESPQP